MYCSCFSTLIKTLPKRCPSFHRYLHPLGLPADYSFVSTFRMLGRTPGRCWNLWTVCKHNLSNRYWYVGWFVVKCRPSCEQKVKNGDGMDEVGIRLNGVNKLVEFFARDEQGHIQTVTFKRVLSLFNNVSMTTQKQSFFRTQWRNY